MIHDDHVQRDAPEKIDAQIARAGAGIRLSHVHENDPSSPIALIWH
jgi:hypothetical protein